MEMLKLMNGRTGFRAAAAFALVLVVAVVSARGQDDEEEDDGGFAVREGTPPARRTGGATRNRQTGGDPPPEVHLLSPQNVAGYTTKDQPTILWSLSKETEDPVTVSVTNIADGGNPEEVLLVTLNPDGPLPAGVHRFDLSKHKDEDGG